jgi:hypothetical protein
MSMVKNIMDEICENYPSKVKKYKQAMRTIEFINGDMLKGYSLEPQRDGINADVAIGYYAKECTYRSKVKNPVWSFPYLLEYINNIPDESDELMAYLCADCRKINTFLLHKQDEHACKECGGFTIPFGLVAIDISNKPDFTVNIKLKSNKDGLVTNIHICDERYAYPEFLTKHMHTPGSK